MSLVPKDIYEKEFAISKHGYDQVQVDNFLDEVILELQQRERAYNELHRKYEELSASAVAAAVTAAVTPQPRSTEPSEESRAAAERIINEAKNKAGQLINEAKARIQDMVSGYKEESKKFTEDRDIVKKQYEQICERFYNMLETQKKALELHYKPQKAQMLGNIPLERVAKEEPQAQPMPNFAYARED